MKKYYASFAHNEVYFHHVMFKAPDFNSAMTLAQVYIWAVNREQANKYQLDSLTTSPKRKAAYLFPMGE